ncbi:MAG: hypothetical protein HDT02_03645 [Bacteroidales bacterium]|nr:hypothetical protein [Bacteroidales bacterium]
MIWDAFSFFSDRISALIPARDIGMKTVRVSGLEGLEDAVANMLDAPALCCVSDSSDGDIDLECSPSDSNFKLIFLLIRTPEGDMAARHRHLKTLRLIFHALLSVLIQERTRLENDCLFLDPKIQFHEAPAPLLSGYTCVWFQLRIVAPLDLRINSNLWTDGTACDIPH